MARFRDVMTSFTRNYIPGGPLFAAGALKFQGVQYRQDDPLPVSKMSKARHQRLFITKKANHMPTRKAARAPAAPVVTASLAELTESDLEKLTAPAAVLVPVAPSAADIKPNESQLAAFKKTPSESVTVPRAKPPTSKK